MRSFRLADEQKAVYHLSAVVGCNLLVALESEAKRLMDEATGGSAGLDHLSALLETTLKNLLESGEPAFALTGPVARGDMGTVRAHLRLLDRRSPRLARTYRALSLEALALAAPRLDDEQVKTLQELLGAAEAKPAVIVARTIAEARVALRELPRPLGLVPTMGALHAGHLSLVDAARARCASVVASVFVNPTQFGRGEDFSTYPRDEVGDLRLLEEAGVAVAFAPDADEMYPAGFATLVHVGGALTESFEGASRPGHFDGVTVIVAKLLGVTQPDVLFLGEKDAQQLAVVRRFVRDLDLPVEVAGVPTLREPDGLAMSSRNVRLTPEQRAVAAGAVRRPARGRGGRGGAGRERRRRCRRGHECPAVGRSGARAGRGGRTGRQGPGRAALRARLPRRRRCRQLRPDGRAGTALRARRRGPPRLHPPHRQPPARRSCGGGATHRLVIQRVPRQGRDHMKGRVTMATVFTHGKRKEHVREGLARVITGSIEFSSNGDADMVKITEEVAEAVRQTGLGDGTITLFVPGATGALTTLEYEPGVVEDVQRALDVVAPAGGFYQHNANLGDGNGHSHVRAGLVGPSLVVPFVDGRLTLGRYQDIVFCDFDARPRERSIVAQVMGV